MDQILFHSNLTFSTEQNHHPTWHLIHFSTDKLIFPNVSLDKESASIV